MEKAIQRNKLFVASCLALLVTSLSFGIRAGIMNNLMVDFSKIFKCSFFKITVACMHSSYPVSNSSKKFQGIFTSKVCITWIIIHSKKRIPNAIDQLAKHIHFFAQIPGIARNHLYNDFQE